MRFARALSRVVAAAGRDRFFFLPHTTAPPTAFIGRRFSTQLGVATSPFANTFAYANETSATTTMTPPAPPPYLHTASFFSSTATTTPTGEEMLAAFPNNVVGTNIPLAMHALATADAVCFDVDSTVISEEGIDVLAEYLGQGEAVAALTAAAMEGGMLFQDALQARLDLLQPSRAQLQACLNERPFELTPGVAELIETLHELGRDVYLVSGGFRVMIEPVAARLQIPVSHIYANHIVLDDDSGTYQGFDKTEPTSQDMGKPKAVQQIIDARHERTNGARPYKTVVMVGDGATDAQAKPPATAFVGFGGVAVRPKVQACADWFVTDFADMTAVLKQFGE